MNAVPSRRSFLTAALAVGVLAPVAPAAAAQRPRTASRFAEGHRFSLTILQTNDFHGHLRETVVGQAGQLHENNVAKYATLIEQVRAQEENVLVLDGGDLFLRGEFETLQGQVETEILRMIRYDAMVIGNNDFRVPPAGTGTPETSFAQMQAYQRRLNFPILLGNVVHQDTGRLLRFAKASTLRNFRGVKVGVVGVTSMKPELRGWPDVEGLDFIDPVEALEGGLMADAQRISDIQVVLSHAGNPDDHRIAKVPGVSAVIGADTHKIIRTPETEVSPDGHLVPITQAGGEQEHYLGRLDLTFQMRSGRFVLVEHSGFLYEDLSGVAEDPSIVALIERYRALLATDAAA